ncbi:MAG: YegS/Rv2252/BmrU family lipid kinase [Eubacteriales bacterium]|nr:YegS/Rv2252/BmrU family lipid kinase [Eubacteriales bacterium]
MKKNKVLFFYNPEAGNGLFKNNHDYIIEKFQKKKMYVVMLRGDRKGALYEFLKDMRQDEYRKIIAAGGDGTINTLINAMMHYGIDLPIAIFPSGTANDFAYYFDLPHDLDSIVKIALDEHYTYTDIGRVNNKYFINVAAMGFLVDVSQKTDPDIKNTLGVISYYLKGVSEIPKLKPIPIKIRSEEYTSEEKIYFMLVMNGRSAGGFRRIAHMAEVNDGKMDVIIFKEMPIREMAPLLINILTGQHHENKNVVSFRTSKLYLESDQKVGTDVDGEKGVDFPLDIEVIPRKFKINTLIDDMEGAKW